jgi:hypothetical protein
VGLVGVAELGGQLGQPASTVGEPPEVTDELAEPQHAVQRFRPDPDGRADPAA